MSLKILVATAFAIFLIAQLCLAMENLCPQPTESKPVPDNFMYADRDDCRKFHHCVFGEPVLSSCPSDLVFNDNLQVCVFDDEANSCLGSKPATRCSSFSDQAIAHPTACQRYYNCSDNNPRPVGSRFEAFEQECQYPQLFDIETKQCQPFDRATCSPGSVATVEPCDYFNNLCGSLLCVPCNLRLPSCAGKEDGLWPFPGRLYTSSYIRCDTGRLAAILECKRMLAIFLPRLRRCSYE